MWPHLKRQQMQPSFKSSVKTYYEQKKWWQKKLGLNLYSQLTITMTFNTSLFSLSLSFHSVKRRAKTR